MNTMTPQLRAFALVLERVRRLRAAAEGSRHTGLCSAFGRWTMILAARLRGGRETSRIALRRDGMGRPGERFIFGGVSC